MAFSKLHALGRTVSLFRHGALRGWRLLLAGVVLLAAGPAAANHVLGGNITYTCLGGNNYLVDLGLFYDCTGNAAIPQTLNFTSACGTQSVTITPPTPVEVSQICPSQLANSTCNGGGLQGVNLYNFQTTVNLPPCPGGWLISYVVCCRALTLNLVGQSGTYIDATLRNDLAPCVNSPQFAQNSVPYICVGQPFSFNFGAVAASGQHLQYTLIGARGFADTQAAINYQAGYSGTMPVPGTTLDPLSGQMSFTPSVTGKYVFVVRIDQYDANGVLIGSVMRDIMLIAMPCTSAPPVVPGFATLVGSNPGVLNLGNNTIEVCNGAPFCFSLTFTDPDAGDVLAVTSQAASLMPGSVVTVTGTNPMTVQVCWTGDIAHSPVNLLLQVNDGACPIMNTATAGVTITSVTPLTGLPNPGTNSTVQVCPTAAVFNMIGQLNGAPNPNGHWTGPNLAPHGPQFDPAVDPPGVYTYMVGNACSNASATLTISFTANAPDAGTSGTLNLCGSAAPVALISGLGGTPDATGTWTRQSTGATVPANFDPATGTPGVFVYTVPGTAGCPSVSSTVTVTVTPAANAGTNGTLSVCANGAAASLFAALGGTPAVGGAWSGPSPVVGGMYNPASMNPGVYTYTLAGTAPCANATATVTVTRQAVPNAGTNGTLTICASAAPASLFTSLGGSPAAGGAWSGPSPVTGGMYDPATMNPGVYTYTVAGVAPCANATATVTVSLQASPDAGGNGTLTLCANGAASNLANALTGSPAVGGAWSGPSPVTGGMYDPATMLPGVYTYTVTGTAPCANATATVAVSLQAAPDAGGNGTLTLCANGAASNLANALTGSPAVGGAWSGPSPVTGGMYDPATMNPGVYTYTVAGVAPCANATATVAVTLQAAPDAGGNGTLTLCANGAASNLANALTGSPAVGGAWSGPSPVTGGMYDPSTMLPGVYTYTVTGTAPCANATATVAVSLQAAPDAGGNGTLTLCANGAAANLANALTGTPAVGGAWSGPSPVTGGMYDPATMNPGVYTYTVAGVAPCANATATVTVSLQASPDAGGNGTLTLCANGAASNLANALTGSPAVGGAWSGPSPVTGGMYDPATMLPGVYTYTVTGTAPCANATATVAVSLQAAPDAGGNGTLTLCANGAASNLANALTGSPAVGGAWSGPSPVTGGMYDPATMLPGVYTYTVAGVAPCANATATVTVSLQAAPDAGGNGTLTLCANGAASNLANALTGSPAVGGAWSGPSPVTGGMYDPATMNPGVYTYTVAGVAPCANATAMVTVSLQAAPVAGGNGTLTLCANGAASNLANALTGSPAVGGAWSGPSPVTGGMYDPSTMLPGVYTYTVAGVAPCANATATVTVSLQAAPVAGGNGTLTLCANGAASNLANALTGSPAVGGAWSGPSPVAGGMYDPSTMLPGVYTYTVAGVAPCANATATVAVSLQAAANAGSNTSLTLCSSNSTTNLFFVLTGAQFGGTWVGPAGAFNGNFVPGVDPPGNYTYTVQGIGPCPNAQATVAVTEIMAPNAGRDTAVAFCSSDNAVNLINLLANAQSGGAWQGGFTGTFVPGTTPPGTFTYVVPGVAPCLADQASITVSVTPSPGAGTDNSLTVCDQGAATSLFAALGGAPNAGGTWSGPSAVTGGMYDPATMNPGAYVYTVAGTAPCGNASATVTVTETGSPNAGTNGAVTVCSTGGAVNLFSSLGGTPDAGGTWSGGLVNGMFDPAVNTAGVYTYTLNATPPCQSAQAGVTVTVVNAPGAGSDNSLTVCDQGAATSLFAALGGAPNAGGTWSGPSAVTGGMYDPVTMNPGAYVYTVTGAAPCGSASATVTVTETGSPNAGTNGAVTVCSTGGAVNLFSSLGGTPVAGGTWSGGITGGMFDPAVNTTGVYTYTLSATPPCQSAQAGVTVTVVNAPGAGTDNSLTVCDQGAATSLFAALGGAPNAGGTWSGPSAVTGGMYDPATMNPGAYVYTVAGTAPCGNASATVTVTETGSPNAGTNGAVTVCSTGGAVNLFSSLGGTPDAGGTWSGGLVNGMFDPAVNTAGVYTYTLSATPPCQSAQAGVTVTVVNAPGAGTDNSLAVCDQGAATSLFAALGGAPNAGGTWSGPSAVTGGMYDPVTMNPGAYVYTVAGAAPCGSASATVTVTETGSPNAGTNGAVTVCSTGGAVNLFSSLGGAPDAGGTWSGGLVNGMFDPAVNTAGVYTYTLSATPPCQSAQAGVTVTVVNAPGAGTDNSLTVCDQGAATSLFAALGGAPNAGGTWSGPSAVTGGMYDPATMNPGAYVYTVTGTAPCGSASATVTVTETGSPNAGTNGAVTVCSTGGAVNLFSSLGGTPDAGGTWSGGITGGMFDPAVNTGGVYTYTLSATPPCQSAQASVTVTVVNAPGAGTDNSLTVCDQGAATSLFVALGGTPNAGGTWSGPSTVVGGMYDPATMNPGAYVYTVAGAAPCGSASATVTVTETGSPNAGTNGAVTVCSTGGAVNLFSSLGGTPDAGGTWSGGLVNGMFDPAVNTAGVYTYTLSATPPCQSTQAGVTVTVVNAPGAGMDNSLTVCDQGAATSLFAALGGAPNAGGTWSGPSAVTGGMYDPATMNPGAYVYTVAGTAPCGNASATVTVTETGSPNAGTNGAVTVCSTGGPVNLFSSLGGTPDAGGTWSGGLVNGMFDPAVNTGGVYTYTLSATPPCQSAQAGVTVTVVNAPGAGTDNSLTVCDQGAATSLFAALGGVPNAGGTWSGPSAVTGGMYDPATMNPGAYVYTVAGTAPCGNASATVTVTETGSPNAGTNGAVTVCSTGGAVNLFSSLGGTPDAGGTWSGGITGGMFDPATMNAGVYTYTVGAVAPCTAASASVVVAIEALHNAGIGSSASFCTGDAPVNLLTLLGGTPEAGGSWSGPAGASNGTFDPAASAQGAYTYTIAGTACPSVTSTLVITVLNGPNAGQGNAIALCSSGPVVNLMGMLTGSPEQGGTWTGPGGALQGASIDPSTAQGGDYTYTVAGNASCPDASAVVVITINQAVSAGTSGQMTVCSDGQAVPLFNALGGTPNTGGTWASPPDNAPFSGTLDPATAQPGNYIYTVHGSAPCPSATAQVTVVIVQAPDAGNDSTVVLCSSTGSVDMLDLLGGSPDPGGSWTDPQGNATSALFAPGSSMPGMYRYTVPALSVCAQDVAHLTMEVVHAAQAGTGRDTTVCANGDAFQLASLLSGVADAGGTWSGPGIVNPNGLINPAVAASGAYVYTVTPQAPCPQAAATVHVAILAVPAVTPTYTMHDGCAPVLVTFNADHNGGGLCHWDFGNGAESGDCGPVSITYDAPGNYHVQFTFEPGNGCPGGVPTDLLVPVVAKPVAAFDVVGSTISTDNPVAAFANHSSGAGSYAWDFGHLGSSAATSPQFTFPADIEQIYPVCLIAYASPTCADTVCSDVLIPASASVYVPNAFSPDKDGNNEGFGPVSMGLDPNDYLFIIMDRWGHMVYSTKDTQARWDGTFNGGNPAPQGVYVWKLTAQDMIAKTRFERIGHVTLIR